MNNLEFCQKDAAEFNHLAVFFYKPNGYSFEKEFRMLLPPGRDPIGLDEVGRPVPIRLRKIVHRVVTHPGAPATFKTEVDLTAASMVEASPERGFTPTL